MPQKVSIWIVLVILDDEDKEIEVGFDTGEVETGQGGHSYIVTEL